MNMDEDAENVARPAHELGDQRCKAFGLHEIPTTIEPEPSDLDYFLLPSTTPEVRLAAVRVLEVNVESKTTIIAKCCRKYAEQFREPFGRD